jgi:alkane 1-monooxygenase
MPIKAFKYLSPILLYAAAWVAFSKQGFWVFLPLVYSFVVIPGAELFYKPVIENLSAAEEEMAKKNRLYDWMLYLIVPLQYAALVYFLYSITTASLLWWELAGRVLSMGLLCGTFGINVAHELGHRTKKYEQVLAKILLASSLYMHFFIEHNKGHHKHVATPQDPSSARRGEPVYLFYFRTIIYSYISAWHIANKENRKAGHATYSLHNDMVRAQLWQLLLIVGIYFMCGGFATLLFLAAALLGALLLETVNYIEHYGLQRKATNTGTYERTQPEHSWNSSHPLGRIMLFELSRHSDHHYLASRKYQILRHHEAAPQLPTGYPGSMLLSLIPPLWFKIMHKKIDNLPTTHAH